MPSASDHDAAANTARQPAALPRPPLPPVLLASLGLWLGTTGSYSWTEGRGSTVITVLAVAGMLAAVVLLFVLFSVERSGVKQQARARFWLTIALGLALGCASGAIGAGSFEAQKTRFEGVSGSLELIAVSDARVGEYRTSVECRLCGVDGKALVFGPKVTVYTPDASIRYGDRYCIDSALSASKTSYLRSRGIVATCTARESEAIPVSGVLSAICKVRNGCIDAIAQAAGSTPSSVGSGAAAVLQALVCGYRTELFSHAVYDEFKIAGVAHLVAVSGAHLTVMVLVASLLIRQLRMPKRLALSLEFALLVLYLVFSAIPISALRAAIMVSLALASVLGGRRPAVLNALGICIIGVCVLNPAEASGASFVLSATSTLGIVLFAGLAARWTETLFQHIGKTIRDAVSLTLSASLLSLPFSIALFSQCSLILLISNIICGVLFTPVCAFGMLASLATCVLPSLGEVLLRAAIALCDILCTVVHLLSCIPYACIPATLSMTAALCLALGAACLLWIIWPEPSVLGVRVCVSASCALLIAVALVGMPQDRVVMLDVGQGDAILLQSGGRTILIDTGNDLTLLKQALARSHIVHLDGVVITHPDADHCACLDELSTLCTIDAVYVAHDLLDGECAHCESLRTTCEVCGLDLRPLSREDVLSFGSFTCEVVWPVSYSSCGGNGDSLCLLLTVAVPNGERAYQALFTGDAGYEELDRLVTSGWVGDIDILKVGHHGSATALSTECLSVLRPEISLISVGESNRYGHPTETALAQLEACDSQVYRTDISGDISVKFTGKGIMVRTQR